MKVAILSDIHANLEALQASLLAIKELKVDRVVCLGDIVGYGPDPDECVGLVRENCDAILLGNHDEAVVQPNISERFNDYARWAVEWTSEHISSDNKKFLAALPRTHTEGKILYAHSSPKDPEKWTYIFSKEDAEEQFHGFEQDVCFVGHTHHPALFCEDEEGTPFSADHRFIVNVGSIGQPRDGNPKSCFGLFDDEKWEFRHVRAAYDVQRTATKIATSGLPALLGERLLYGR